MIYQNNSRLIREKSLQHNIQPSKTIHTDILIIDVDSLKTDINATLFFSHE